MSKNKSKALLILHRKSCARPEVREAVRQIRESGIDLEVRIPWGRRDIRRQLKEAATDKRMRIIAGGGDGTLNKVVNALLKTRKPHAFTLGILPLGTANDFARGANIPLDDLPVALKLACTAKGQKVDIGQVNGEYFVNVASGGFGAEVTASTPQDMKRKLGGSAYTLMGLVKAFDFQPYEGRLILPDGTVEEGQMLIMAVGNNRFAGGGFDVAPKADLTDGLLDVAVLVQQLGANLAKIAAELADPLKEDNEYLRYRQLAAFVIETDRPLHINLDGEPIIASRFEFKTRPRAITMALG